jgi:Zn-dependent peptidase ImmA (M78 family)
MAAEMHSDLKISLDHPVDIFDAVERLGIVLAFVPLGRASGLYLPNQETPGILLNDGHPRTRQRYTAGHELGHHAFRHAGDVDFDIEGALLRGDVQRWPDREKEAEAFGAWFLMPRRLMRRGLESIGVQTPTSPYDVYTLSLWLGTSFTATARQLGATRIVPYHVAESWARIPPRTLKLALAGELAPDDLRNDVFWLN